MTTVEFAAVVAVTALMAALGVSAFRTYTVRTQVTASLAVAADIQQRVAHAFRTSGVPPADWVATGLPIDAGDVQSEFVEAIDIVQGRIEIRFGRAANEALTQRTLSLTPFETADLEIVWICGNKRPSVGLNPLGFASGAGQANPVPTEIETRYLPPACY